MFPKMILLATSTLLCVISPFVAASGGFGHFINPSETDGQPNAVYANNVAWPLGSSQLIMWDTPYETQLQPC